MAREPENPVKPFNNPDVVTQSWYVLAKSKEVRRGRALTKELLGRRIALFRGDSGRVYALDARCPHLGANLGQGKVIGDELRCSFHHWTYSGEGTCTGIPYRDTIPPGARTFSYPTEEKYGVIWIFNGPVPSFPLPSFPKEQRLRMIRLSPKTLNCHPHVIIPNALDMNHWNSVHGFPLMDEPIVDIPDKFRVSVRWRLAVSGRLRGLLSLLGDSLGWLSCGREPVE